MKTFGIVILAAVTLIASENSSTAQGTPSTTTFDGKCLPISHISDGGINEDLSKRRSRFFCSSVVISYLDGSLERIMVQFVDKSSNHAPILGFAGRLDPGSKEIAVDHVYLQPGQPITPVDGVCKLFFSHTYLHSVTCGARIEEGDRATVPVVAFNVY